MLLGHGSGGSLSAELIREVFIKGLAQNPRAALEDQAILKLEGLAGRPGRGFSYHGFVCAVRARCFFLGGGIGTLAVHGTA